jgi:DNA-binding CsgD family transcriptional regulator
MCATSMGNTPEDSARLDTAKKHISHVLGKLGAGNRTEASPGQASSA